MHKNHLYNLMQQMVQEEKSLWRIDKCYLKDAKGCRECTAFWNGLKKDKESHVKDLTKMIKRHLAKA